ncbi:dienelactone hydrolase family protein [Caldibacillus lycopersici]|uniref:Dienelactone hydrolase family protein n=1 Tax=Perspicuibacillus lycopersici TaxID=1325689 RepID=A0AAE3IUH6_9BACI|nr:alpha/beta fold hydrolase [Perspicuibacillus lycopersici]MCU9614828.1 dienelactone hydrolase family protein [Perspicuibacillus lycopersici]
MVNTTREYKKTGPIVYHVLEPMIQSSKQTTVILYHGWGGNVANYDEAALEIATKGYTVLIPELIHHNTRNPIENPFTSSAQQKYFWETIFTSIEELDLIIESESVAEEQIVLIGNSMGGFIANGVFSKKNKLKGLATINGSGSFLLTEKLFRKQDGRPELSLEEEIMLKKYDPIGKQVATGSIFILHGDSDRIIPIEGNQDYYRYLTEIEGKTNIDFRVYPNVNHQFTDEMFADVLHWLECL